MLLKTLIIEDIVKKIYLVQLANTIYLLARSDTRLLLSVALVWQIINYYLIFFLLKADEHIVGGDSPYKIPSNFPFYPAKKIQLIKDAEEKNRMYYFFEKIVAQYAYEIEYRSNTIISLSEPLIIVLFGLIVGIILVAMYLLMFQMSNGF